MQLKKKIISVLLTSVVLLSFSACNDTSVMENVTETTEDSNSAAAEGNDKPTNEPNTAQPKETDYSPLDLLNCQIGEDGIYRIDQDMLNATDDYDLFRKYFFGTWEGNFCFPDSAEQESIIIDDSMKSYIMTESDIRLGDFYEVNGNVLAFLNSSSGGSSIHWVDTESPDTMYIVWGGVTNDNYLWSREEDGSFTASPTVYSLKKTSVSPNEPEENFLSIYKLREISRDYGIGLDMLIDIEYESEDGTVSFLHDDWYQFYPVYLVSEAPDRLEFKTLIGNVYYENSEIEAIYTIEKIDGEWVRTVDFDDVTNPL